MKEKIKKFFMFFLGAIFGLIIEVGFESPIHNLLFPDNIVELEFVIKDDITLQPVPNLNLLLMNIGEGTTDSEGAFSFTVNETKHENVALRVEDPMNIYETESNIYEANSPGNKIYVSVSKKNY